MKYVFNFLTLILFIGCNQAKKPNPPVSNRDTLLNSYFRQIDSSSFEITDKENLKLLKAYQKGDTNCLKSIRDSLTNELRWNKSQKQVYKAIGLPKLEELKYKEVYRFEFRRAFCNKVTFLTLGKIKDTFELEVRIVEVDYDDSKFIETQKRLISLTEKQWNEFISDLDDADFWGLKYSNGNGGFDGSSLYVQGLKKPNNYYLGESNSVYRWKPFNYQIGKLFIKLFKISGSKVDCY